MKNNIDFEKKFKKCKKISRYKDIAVFSVIISAISFAYMSGMFSSS